jgi:hypothetical protein
MMNDAPMAQQKFAFLADFLYLLSTRNSTPASKSFRRLQKYILAAFLLRHSCAPPILAQAGR